MLACGGLLIIVEVKGKRKIYKGEGGGIIAYFLQDMIGYKIDPKLNQCVSICIISE